MYCWVEPSPRIYILGFDVMPLRLLRFPLTHFHSFFQVRIDILRHERLLYLAEKFNVGPSMQLSGDIAWNTIVSTPFGKKSVGGSAITAAIGSVWLLDVTGFNALALPFSSHSSGFLFKKKAGGDFYDDFGSSCVGTGAPIGRG